MDVAGGLEMSSRSWRLDQEHRDGHGCLLATWGTLSLALTSGPGPGGSHGGPCTAVHNAMVPRAQELEHLGSHRLSLIAR